MPTAWEEALAEKEREDNALAEQVLASGPTAGGFLGGFAGQDSSFSDLGEGSASQLGAWQASRTPSEPIPDPSLPDDGPVQDAAVSQALAQSAPGYRNQVAQDIQAGVFAPKGPSDLDKLAKRSRGTAWRHGRDTKTNRGLMDDAQAKRAEAANLLGDLSVSKAADAARMERDQIEKEQAALGVRQEAKVLEQERVAAYEGELQKEVQAFKDTKIDPDKFFKDEDGNENYGKRIMASIAMALGAFGSGLTGGPNTAAKIITDQINNDISSQRANLQTMKEGIGEKRTNFARLREKFKDNDLAYLADKSQRIEAHQQALGALDTEYAGAEKSMQIQDTNAQLEMTKIKTNQDFSDRAAKMAQAGHSFEGGLAMAQARADAQNKPKPLLEAGAGVKFRRSATDEDKKGVQALKLKFSPMMNAVNSLEKLAEAGATWSKTDTAIAEGALQSFLSMKNQMIGAGTMQEAEFDRAVKAYRNPTDHSMVDMKKLWKRIKADAQKDFATQLDGFNADYTGFASGAPQGAVKGMRAR